MRIFSISDVHIDFSENWQWVLDLSKDAYKDDTLIVAGDITHELALLESFFRELVSRFAYVSFVPGNHDLWIAKSDTAPTSVAKFEEILALCARCGVGTDPHLLTTTEDGVQKNVWIVPLFSWYHEDFDDDVSTLHEPIEYWNDFKMCIWPDQVLNAEDPTPSSPAGTPERWFLSLNEEKLQRNYFEGLDIQNTTIITFSHFLPRRDCLPPKSVLWIKYLPKVVGTTRLDEQIRKIGANIHVFGHTHILWNEMIDNVQYVQMCLKYPRERANHPQYSLKTIEEMKIYDSKHSQAETYQSIKDQSTLRKSKA
jgi:predicted phosphodiesterase